MRRFDTRWITYPIVCLLAIKHSDISWQVIFLITIGILPVYIKY